MTAARFGRCSPHRFPVVHSLGPSVSSLSVSPEFKGYVTCSFATRPIWIRKQSSKPELLRKAVINVSQWLRKIVRKISDAASTCFANSFTGFDRNNFHATWNLQKKYRTVSIETFISDTFTVTGLDTWFILRRVKRRTPVVGSGEVPYDKKKVICPILPKLRAIDYVEINKPINMLWLGIISISVSSSLAETISRSIESELYA